MRTKLLFWSVTDERIQVRDKKHIRQSGNKIISRLHMRSFIIYASMTTFVRKRSTRDKKKFKIILSPLYRHSPTNKTLQFLRCGPFYQKLIKKWIPQLNRLNLQSRLSLQLQNYNRTHLPYFSFRCKTQFLKQCQWLWASSLKRKHTHFEEKFRKCIPKTTAQPTPKPFSS